MRAAVRLALAALALALAPAPHAQETAARVAATLSRFAVHGEADVAVQELARLGPDAVPELVRAFCAARGGEADVVLRALQEARPERVAAALKAELGSAPTTEQRRAALAILERTARPAELELCLAAACAPAGTLAQELQATLAAMLERDPAFLGELASYWPSLEHSARHAAARACGDVGGGPAAEFLAGLLGSPGHDGVLLAQIGRCADTLPRSAAEIAAENVRPYAASPRESEGLKKSVVVVLGKLEDDGAVPILIDLLEHGSEPLVHDAHWALRRITGLALPCDPASWRAWHQREMTWWTRRSSAAFADLGAREPLVAAAAVREVSEHRLARHALARELVRGLKHAHASVRSMTVDALTTLGSREAVPALIEALEDKDAGVRGACLAALRALTGQDHGEEAGAWAGLVAAR